jgi:hypothetical protein
MTYVMTIDPGMTTGLVLAHYGELEPLTILGKYEIEGGWNGLKHDVNFRTGMLDADEIVCEKFSPLPRVFRLNELEPLRIEGGVDALADEVFYGDGTIRTVPIYWQVPGAMNIAGTNNGGSTRAQKAAANKRAADDVLRAAGLWSLPSDSPEHGDSNDINSAMKHLVAHMRRIGHAPTLQAVLHV